MSKLWQKTTNVNQLVENFTVGRDTEFDAQMAAFDVLGSLAHTRMLESIGLMSGSDLILVQAELKNIYKNIEAGDFGRITRLGLQHLVGFGRGHPAREILRRRYAGLTDLRDDVAKRLRGIVQLLVKVTSQQQDCIFQLALAAFDGVITEIGDHHHGTDRDCRDQQNAANDQPENWIAPAG